MPTISVHKRGSEKPMLQTLHGWVFIGCQCFYRSSNRSESDTNGIFQHCPHYTSVTTTIVKETYTQIPICSELYFGGMDLFMGAPCPFMCLRGKPTAGKVHLHVPPPPRQRTAQASMTTERHSIKGGAGVNGQPTYIALTRATCVASCCGIFFLYVHSRFYGF